MCDYQGYEFGAGYYPDSVCIDGRLFDADYCDGDGNLYDDGCYIPCPICNPHDCVLYWFESNQDCTGKRGDVHALKRAVSLVSDIRKNRGEQPIKFAKSRFLRENK